MSLFFDLVHLILHSKALPYLVSKTENEIFVSFVKSRFRLRKRDKEGPELTGFQNEN